MAAATETAPANGVASPEASQNASLVHNSSLYVGDLDREVTEAQLFEMFSQVGPVASIRVCRDAVTRRSLGYAYVNYNSTLDPEAAERAIETLNYSLLGGKPMRIMWSHRDPSFRKSGVGNIFIKNLDKSIDNKALHDTFSAFGNILSCKVATDSSAESKGYGFVHYEKDESAQEAIAKVNGMLLEGKKVYVGPFKNRADRPGDKDVSFTNVYVKNLPDSVDDDQLKDMFGAYGEITSAVVMKDDDGKPKGFGFVNFVDADCAKKAVDELNEKEVDGKEIYAGRAQKKTERESALKQKFDEVRTERNEKFQGMNLYVKNLVDEVDDERLRSEFAPFGTITSAKVMRDSATGKSKGFGFVCFSSPEEATRAVTELNSHMLLGKPIYVALAQRKEVRKSLLEQQHMVPRVQAPGPRGPPGAPVPGMFPGMGANPGNPMYYGGANQMNQMGQPARGPNPNMNGMMYGGGAPMMPGPRNMGMQGGRGRMQQGGMGWGGMQQGGGMYPPQGGPMGPGGPMAGGRGPMGGRGGRGGRGRMADMGGRGGPGRGGANPPPPQRNALPRVQPPPPPPQAPAPAPVPPASSAVVPGQMPGQDGSALTTAMLAAASPEAQKQMLGERLYPQVAKLQPDLAGKITGMLIEMDNSELLLLLESADALESKVQEAIEVLKQHSVLPAEGAEKPAEAAA